MLRTRLAAITLCAGLLLATALLGPVWSDGASFSPDYLLESLVSAGARTALGFVGLGLIVLGGALILGRAPAGLPPLVVLSILAALGYRVISAPVSGANIGGAMVIFVSAFVALGLVRLSLWRTAQSASDSSRRA
ncbi:MAG: hypothetical protein P8J50_05335 [Acidimicrobiales bacterium]|jgi:hypothetical protein|nr:hypothetical protein [Acidimicrobiales bacterium]